MRSLLQSLSAFLPVLRLAPGPFERFPECRDPVPPFWGTRVIENVQLDNVFPYINESALIKGQWQVRKGKKTESEYKQFLVENIYPDLTG